MSNEIAGVTRIVLYENSNVQFRWPDITKPLEFDLLSYSGASIVVTTCDYPTFERENVYNSGYKRAKTDTIEFTLDGFLNETVEIIDRLVEAIHGFWVEILFNNGKNVVLPEPMFVSDDMTKAANESMQRIVMSYREPTEKLDYTKLNTLVLNYSFIIGGNNTLLAGQNTTKPYTLVI